jgi:hypothetical protein
LTANGEWPRVPIHRENIPAALEQKGRFSPIPAAQINCESLLIANVVWKIGKNVQQELARGASLELLIIIFPAVIFLRHE